MSDHLARQLVLLRQLIREYREGELSLNLLVQRVEGVGAAIDSESWTDSAFNILLSMEQINAVTLDTQGHLMPTDTVEIEKSLVELETLIGRWASGFKK
ncbi:hypothetical protein HX890_06205 [Pseudomonas gingeri]|uniref:hypothetical protein n=1 Tax=Pseudomonas gingeri TaxID=117681 RepID=UPI0015A0693D|nr:hypothetical protein [Pseudomonas gingeri]NWD73713.1 hypothetical protein [Pseudomonas gingeri]